MNWKLVRIFSGAIITIASIAIAYMEISNEYNFILGIVAAIGCGLVFNWITFRKKKES